MLTGIALLCQIVAALAATMTRSSTPAACSRRRVPSSCLCSLGDVQQAREERQQHDHENNHPRRPSKRADPSLHGVLPFSWHDAVTGTATAVTDSCAGVSSQQTSAVQSGCS